MFKRHCEVNVRVKFYSIEGATVYDAAYSVNWDLQTLFSTPVINSKMSLFLVEITFARGRHRSKCRLNGNLLSPFTGFHCFNAFLTLYPPKAPSLISGPDRLPHLVGALYCISG